VHAEPGTECPYLERAYSGAVRGLLVPGRAWSRTDLARRVFQRPRVLVKGVASVMAAGWLQQNYDAKMVSVYRHPCAVALSEYERNIDAPGSRTALLDSPTMWTGKYSSFRVLIERATEPFEVYGAIWGLRNRVLLDAQKAAGNWVALHYEELARDPFACFESLFAQLDIPYTDEIRQLIAETTSSHRDGYYSTSRVSASRIGRWKTRLTPEQIDQTLRAAAPFDVPFAE